MLFTFCFKRRVTESLPVDVPHLYLLLLISFDILSKLNAR